jgi:hypothetical protein
MKENLWQGPLNVMTDRLLFRVLSKEVKYLHSRTKREILINKCLEHSAPKGFHDFRLLTEPSQITLIFP